MSSLLAEADARLESTNKVEKAAAVTEQWPACFHHGPAPPTPDVAARLNGTWQLAATRNYAAAEVVADLGVQRVKFGESRRGPLVAQQRGGTPSLTSAPKLCVIDPAAAIPRG
jgi:hypothetical protein